MRSTLVAVLAGACVVAAGCGNSIQPFPGHGLLFAHSGSAKRGLQTISGALYLWRPGSAPVRLTDSSLLSDDPAWSPNGTQIAFTTTGPCGPRSDAECAIFPEVFVADSSGGSLRQLTHSASNEFRSVDPSWSPDGKHIVVQRELNNYTELAIVPAAGGKIRLLGEGFKPTWGGPGIAYLAKIHSRASPTSGRYVIRLLDPKTGDWRPFASPPVGFSDQAIAWSPRDRLASLDASLRPYDHRAHVTLYSSTGRQVAQFEVPKRWRTCGLTWAPGGTRLLLAVFPARGPVHPQLYIVNSNGRHWRLLRVGLPLTSCSVSWR
jgi:dipeptidyl aminopeptidase/acylaminoacyl peptidase